MHKDTKEKIKNELMNTLIDPLMVIVKSGANVISNITAIEFPRE